MKTTKANLIQALATGTLHLLLSAEGHAGGQINQVRSIEREDGSGVSFNVYTYKGTFYVRTVD